MDEKDRILTVQSGNSQSLIGGWITRDYDGNHSLEKAVDSAYIKIAQETNNGDDPISVENFYRNHNIQIMDSFSYDMGKYGHLVTIARYLPGDVPLVGNTDLADRYIVHNHKWLNLADFDSNEIKRCSRMDIRKMVSRGIPLF